MDVIGGTVKSAVYRDVMAGKLVPTSAQESASYANNILKTTVLFVDKQQVVSLSDSTKSVKPPDLQIGQWFAVYFSLFQYWFVEMLLEVGEGDVDHKMKLEFLEQVNQNKNVFKIRNAGQTKKCVLQSTSSLKLQHQFRFLGQQS